MTVVTDLDHTIRAMDLRLRSERLIEVERLRSLPDVGHLAQSGSGASRVGVAMPACAATACWCPGPVVDEGCRAFREGALGGAASRAEHRAGAASALASRLIALRPAPAADPPRLLVAATSAGPSRGFIVAVLPEPAAQDELRAAIAGRLPLYGVAMLSPLLLLGSLLAAARRVALADAEAARARAEAGREAADARWRLAVAASEAASLGLRELGHEVLSPASTLLRSLAARRTGEAATDDGAWLDAAEGCVRRIARAGERARSALRLQQRHADALREGRPVDVCAFLRERVRAEQLAGDLPCRFDLPDAPARVVADLGDLEDVVGNLLANARRFRGSEPVSIVVSVARDWVRMAFHNRGPQIDPNDMARIFEPWVSLAPGDDGANQGLGLWFVRQAVLAMGGTVEVENDPPPATTGVRFVIALPRAG